MTSSSRPVSADFLAAYEKGRQSPERPVVSDADAALIARLLAEGIAKKRKREADEEPGE